MSGFLQQTAKFGTGALVALFTGAASVAVAGGVMAGMSVAGAPEVGAALTGIGLGLAAQGAIAYAFVKSKLGRFILS